MNPLVTQTFLNSDRVYAVYTLFVEISIKKTSKFCSTPSNGVQKRKKHPHRIHLKSYTLPQEKTFHKSKLLKINGNSHLN